MSAIVVDINELIRSQCTIFLTPENIRKLQGVLMFSGGRERVHWERMGSNIWLVDISNIYKIEVLGRFSMYYRFLMYVLMYACISPQMFLILLLYRLTLSQFCLKFIWTSNYLIKEIISQTVVALLFCFCYGTLFWILVQLTIQCNNSYHSEKRRAIKFVILFLVLLLQFKVMLSSDKYKKISLHVFL